MIDDQGLINYAANDFFGIDRAKEDVNDPDFKRRVVYTIIGVSAIAALLDQPEGGIEEEDGRVTVANEVSVIHVKRRIKELWQAYLALFPELFPASEFDLELAAQELYDLLIASGCAHAAPYRVYPCAHTEAPTDTITFTRGQPLLYGSIVVKRSGIGAYYANDHSADGGATAVAKPMRRTIQEMFQLSLNPLADAWRSIERSLAEPEDLDVLTDHEQYEYLLTSPPFPRGYFTTRLTEREGAIFLARTRLQGDPLYYLCRLEGGRLLGRRLATWRVQNYEYRQLANAILFGRGTLPPIKFRRRDELVDVELQYLLPPAELNWFRLYSWPINFVQNEYGMNSFKRIMTSDVFPVFQHELTQLGYQFDEEK